MRNYITNKKLNNASKIALTCVFWLVIWQVAAICVGNTLLLPNIFETVSALGILLKMESFYMSVAWTLFRCILAIAISFLLGCFCAWMAYKRALIKNLMVIPVSFFKAVPVMAIVIYVILLVEANWVAVVACLLMCFPIVYTNILGGLESVSVELLEVAKVYRLGNADVVKLIYMPSVVPHFNAAMKIVAGLSWKAVVAAEVLSVPEFSLGQGMISAKYYLETPTLFAYIFVIVGLSLALEKLIVALTANINARNYGSIRLGENRAGDCKEVMPLSIKMTNLGKSFGEKKVIDKLNVDIEAGGKVSVVGSSGSGKTTLARLLTGLENYDEGIIEFSDHPRIAYLFQEDRLLPWLNVFENMALAASLNCDMTYDDVKNIAKALEIDQVLYKMPDELSGGMKHRVALGRTFLAGGNLLILDEPFRGLDDGLKKRIVDRLWDTITKDKTVVVISHNESDVKLLGIEKTVNIR